MSAIIWWLESPWQLRAFVFIISFFVCFVGPYLHSQSLQNSSLPARKLSEEKSETALAPQDEGHLRQAAPSAEAARLAQDKVEIQPAPAPAPALDKDVTAHEGLPSTEGERHADQDSKEVPAPQEPAALQEPASVPAQSAALPAGGATGDAESPSPENVTAGQTPPVPTATAQAQDQAGFPAAPEIKTPVQPEQTPFKPEQVPASTSGRIEEAKAPSAPQSPASEEPAATQAPASAAAQAVHGFTIVSQGVQTVKALPGRSVERQDLAVSTENGSAEVEVYVLPLSQDRRPPSPRETGDLASALLDSSAFARAAARYDTIACAGLSPKDATLSRRNVASVTEGGALQFCGVLARKPYVPLHAKIFGLPLKQEPESAASSGKERALWPVAIIGIKNAKGDLAGAAMQKTMVSSIVFGGKITNFPLGGFAGSAPDKELLSIEVKRETARAKNRPVRSATVKRGYAHERGTRLQTLLKRHKQKCPHVHTRISRRDANAETPESKPLLRCALFDFPF